MTVCLCQNHYFLSLFHLLRCMGKVIKRGADYFRSTFVRRRSVFDDMRSVWCVEYQYIGGSRRMEWNTTKIHWKLDCFDEGTDKEPHTLKNWQKYRHHTHTHREPRKAAFRLLERDIRWSYIFCLLCLMRPYKNKPLRFRHYYAVRNQMDLIVVCYGIFSIFCELGCCELRLHDFFPNKIRNSVHIHRCQEFCPFFLPTFTYAYDREHMLRFQLSTGNFESNLMEWCSLSLTR